MCENDNKDLKVAGDNKSKTQEIYVKDSHSPKMPETLWWNEKHIAGLSPGVPSRQLLKPQNLQ